MRQHWPLLRPRCNFTHQGSSVPFLNGWLALFRLMKSCQAYEDIVSPGTHQFTAWVKINPHEVLVHHVVDVQKCYRRFSRDIRNEACYIFPNKPCQQTFFYSITCAEAAEYLQLEPWTPSKEKKLPSNNKLQEGGTSSHCRKRLNMLTTSFSRIGSTRPITQVARFCSTRPPTPTATSSPSTCTTPDETYLVKSWYWRSLYCLCLTYASGPYNTPGPRINSQQLGQTFVDSLSHRVQIDFGKCACMEPSQSHARFSVHFLTIKVVSTWTSSTGAIPNHITKEPDRRILLKERAAPHHQGHQEKAQCAISWATTRSLHDSATIAKFMIPFTRFVIITKWPDELSCQGQTCHRRGMFRLHPLILVLHFCLTLRNTHHEHHVMATYWENILLQICKSENLNVVRKTFTSKIWIESMACRRSSSAI